MARTRLLNDEQLAECRWFYEHSPLSQPVISTAFGMNRGSLFRWAQVQSWVRYQPPKDAETKARHELAAHDRMVKRQAQMAHDKEIARGLEVALKLLRPPPEPPADQPAPPVSADPAPFVAKPAVNLTKPATNTLSVVVPFPGARLPQREAKASIADTREEQAAVKIRLAGLQGAMAVQQLDLIEDHKALLADYTHLMRIYLNPQNYVHLDEGLTPAEADQKLQDVQRAARNLLLPTERDTLAGAVNIASSALKTIIQLGRVVVGVAKGGEMATAPADGAPGERMAEMDLKSLRQVKEAMDMLTGRNRAASEPPMPPAPEPLDDLTP